MERTRKVKVYSQIEHKRRVVWEVVVVRVTVRVVSKINNYLTKLTK